MNLCKVNVETESQSQQQNAFLYIFKLFYQIIGHCGFGYIRQNRCPRISNSLIWKQVLKASLEQSVG